MPSKPVRILSELLSRFRDGLRVCPVTCGIIAAAVVLFLAVWIGELLHSDPSEAREMTHLLGAVTSRLVVNLPGLYGPFKLWDGELWRIPLSGFHHGGLLHLGLNCLGLVFLGRLLESRMKWFSYTVYFLTATTVSLVPEYLAGNNPIGLSGGVYAMFGTLLVLRRRDARIAEALPPGVVQMGLVWLFLCIGLTYLEILRIANLAHFTGLAYGWVAGEVLLGTYSTNRKLRLGFYAAHLLLVPVLYFVVHPVWIGRYHWYLAIDKRDQSRQTQNLEQAVSRDPGLEAAWRLLAAIYAQSGELQRAWETILKGLAYNRSDENANRLAQAIWSRFHLPSDRKDALDTLNKVFGEEAADWRERLGISPAGAESPVAMSRDNLIPEPDVGKIDSQGAFQLRFLQGTQQPFPTRDLLAPDVDPNAPHSAAEGVML